MDTQTHGTGVDRYRIGEWTLIRSRNLLMRDGSEHVLEPRAIELLAFLAARPGEVVSVDNLLEDLWPGRIVTESSVYRVIAELRQLLGDEARNPTYIETVRKRGYRMIAPVERLTEPQSAQAGPPAEAAPRTPARLALLAGFVVAAATIALTGFFAALQDDGIGDAPIALAVLPIEALTPATPGYIPEGLTRGITDQLAAIPELTVISYLSTRDYVDTDKAPREIAAELGVNLLVAGTIVTDDNADAARISLALVDPDTGRARWSRSFEGSVANLIGVQSRFAGQLARELDLELLAEARQRSFADGFDDVAAFEAHTAGMRALDTGFQADSLVLAIDLFTAALERAPTLAPALVGRATAHLRMYYNYHDRSDDRLLLASRDIEAALQADPGSAHPYQALGQFYLTTRQPEKSVVEYRRALELQPSFADALDGIGQAYSRLGRFEDAEENLEAATRIDPRNPRHQYNLALTQHMAGRFAAAEQSYEKALLLSPDMLEAYLYKALLYLSWHGDTAALTRTIDALGMRTGPDDMLTALIQPGLWSVLTLHDTGYGDDLAAFSAAESGADQAAWHLAMADRETRRGNKDAALEHYSEAASLRERDLDVYPDDPWLLAELGVAYAELGDAERAIEVADRAISLAPVEEDFWTNADFLWMKAELLARLGEDTAAVAQIREASRYPGLFTPAYLSADRVWSSVLAHPDFAELVTADGRRWRALNPD